MGIAVLVIYNYIQIGKVRGARRGCGCFRRGFFKLSLHKYFFLLGSEHSAGKQPFLNEEMEEEKGRSPVVYEFINLDNLEKVTPVTSGYLCLNSLTCWLHTCRYVI